MSLNHGGVRSQSRGPTLLPGGTSTVPPFVRRLIVMMDLAACAVKLDDRAALA